MTAKIRFEIVTRPCTDVATGILDERGIDLYNADDEFRECLDDMVLDHADAIAAQMMNEGADSEVETIASEFASNINNLGALGQVSWLLAQGWSSEDIIEKLDEATMQDIGLS